MENKNIDFVDALICAKSKLENYKKLSFDKDLVIGIYFKLFSINFSTSFCKFFKSCELSIK